jgi:uncharacterized membrane protein YgdD (TMEM256/DUF423 family)
MAKLFLSFAAFSAMLAVAMGAFGAHGLKAQLPAERLDVFEAAVRYQMVHALGLFVVAWLYLRTRHPLCSASGIAFILGTVLFSGSLYLLATRGVLGIEHWKWLGPVTPLGGLAFLTGWLLLGIAILRSQF